MAPASWSSSRREVMLRKHEEYPVQRACHCGAPIRTRSRFVETQSGEDVGDGEAARAFTTVHEGAIYLHQARFLRGPRRSMSPGASRRGWGSCGPFDGKRVHAAQAGDRPAHRAACLTAANDGVTLC